MPRRRCHARENVSPAPECWLPRCQPRHVYFDGKPLPGVEVEVGDGVTPTEEKDIPQYRTDQRSIAVVPITRRGPHLFVGDHLESSIQPGLAARELYNATLSFMLP